MMKTRRPEVQRMTTVHGRFHLTGHFRGYDWSALAGNHFLDVSVSGKGAAAHGRLAMPETPSVADIRQRAEHFISGVMYREQIRGPKP